MKIIRKRPRQFIFGVLLSACCSQLLASQIVYVPTNPSFGGNPNNGAYLLNNAQSQNDYTTTNDFGINEQSDLDRFTNTLQSTLLNDILGSASGASPVDQTLTTGNFKVHLMNDGDGNLTVTITDTTTGKSSIIQLANLLQQQ